jgi:crotonobetainyl-CoA:carnitine CoA-transferase CaiB-like acyl-CoA transferase
MTIADYGSTAGDAPGPLSGLRVTCAAIYLPALLAARRLGDLGASVSIVEPPVGNPMRHWASAWYAHMYAGATLCRIDWKTAAGAAQLDVLLDASDVLLTSSRPSTLERVGLGAARLCARFPALCHVAIVGFAPPHEDEAGHDLTYQAHLGLLQPPHLPRMLVADLAGSERAVSAATALLIGRARGRAERRADVSLSDAASGFAAPWRHGMTTPDGILGGAFAGYAIYAAREGWVALAALEPHFWRRIAELLTPDAAAPPDHESLARVFATRGAAEWERWARDNGLPLVEVR